MDANETKHVPVLLGETIEALRLRPGNTVVDATLGGGGHTRAILERIAPGGRLVAMDMDRVAIERFANRAQGDALLSEALASGQLTVMHRNFSELAEALREAGIEKVDAIMADLGFSSDQIESADRGLSFMLEGPLDMRLDPREGLTAEHIVNTYDESELVRIFRDYGDERFASRIARAIVSARVEMPLTTTSELARVVEDAVPAAARRTAKVHSATRVFQALRIVVNREFENLETFLSQAVAGLRSGGRLAVITFHSGEDRIVKRFLQEKARGCVCPSDLPICRCGSEALVRIVTKKPVVAEDGELAENPRARSAKLRVAERIG